MLLRVSEDVQPLYSAETYLRDKVFTITYQMVCTKSVASFAFAVTIIFLKPCGHVGPGVVVTAVSLSEWLYLTTTDALEETARHHVSKTDILGEHLIQFLN